MSRLGLNVALKLNTGQFSQELEKSKNKMRQFGADVKRQNEMLGKLGGAGLGRGFGAIGAAVEGMAMGGIAGGLAAVLVPLGLMVGAMRGLVLGIESVNGAAANARKTMEALAKGDKLGPGALTGFTPLAAGAPTTASTVTMSEVVASNLKPRGGIEDIVKSYLISAGPNIMRAMLAEDFNIFTDIMTGRGAGDVRRRYAAAGLAAVAGDFGPAGAQFAADNLQEARKGNKLVQEQNAILRGN